MRTYQCKDCGAAATRFPPDGAYRCASCYRAHCAFVADVLRYGAALRARRAASVAAGARDRAAVGAL